MSWNYQEAYQKTHTLLHSESLEEAQLRKENKWRQGKTANKEDDLRKFLPLVELCGDCWKWLGEPNQYGYGRIALRGKMTRAHRASFELFVAEAPDSLCVCHTCDNPICVNPAHLFLGTKNANNQDKVQKLRQPHNSQHWNHRLSVSDVLEIRKMHSEKIPYLTIASKFEISTGYVWEIVARKKRLYVP